MLKADELDDATFGKLLDGAVDVTGAKHVEVQIDAGRNVLWVNVNGVCLLRICRIEEFSVKQVGKL